MPKSFLAVMLGALVDDALQGMAVDVQSVGGIPAADPLGRYPSNSSVYSEPFGLVGNLDEMIN